MDQIQKALNTLELAHLEGKVDKETIEKARSQSDELVKGGEGSRGGKVIGHTKSGKPIYESANLHDYNFSRKEHDEAAGIHRAKAKELYEKAGKISGYHTKEEVKKQAKHHSEQADLHEQYYVKDKEKQSKE